MAVSVVCFSMCLRKNPVAPKKCHTVSGGCILEMASTFSRTGEMPRGVAKKPKNIMNSQQIGTSLC